MLVGNKFKFLPPLLLNEKYTSQLTISLKSLKFKGIGKQYFEKCAIRILWWGEKEPSYLRKQEIYLVAPGLLGPYLKLCQVLELTVTCWSDNEDLGSAFLYNPSDILLGKSKFSMPVVDHTGNKVGLMVIEIQIDDSGVKIGNLCKGPHSNVATSNNSKFINAPSKYQLCDEGMLNTKSSVSYQNFDSDEGTTTKSKYSAVPCEVSNFLMGRHMTLDEERKSLALLHQWSPSQSLITLFTNN